MEQLKLYTADGICLTLPKTKQITMGGELAVKEVTMVSGRKVQYVQGFRPAFTAAWDYFPNDLLAEIISLLRKGGYFKVAYPGQDGKEKEGYFSISYPNTAIFCFRDKKPYWHNVSLTFSAQEVML